MVEKCSNQILTGYAYLLLDFEAFILASSWAAAYNYEWCGSRMEL